MVGWYLALVVEAEDHLALLPLSMELRQVAAPWAREPSRARRISCRGSWSSFTHSAISAHHSALRLVSPKIWLKADSASPPRGGFGVDFRPDRTRSLLGDAPVRPPRRRGLRQCFEPGRGSRVVLAPRSGSPQRSTSGQPVALMITSVRVACEACLTYTSFLAGGRCPGRGWVGRRLEITVGSRPERPLRRGPPPSRDEQSAPSPWCPTPAFTFEANKPIICCHSKTMKSTSMGGGHRLPVISGDAPCLLLGCSPGRRTNLPTRCVRPTRDYPSPPPEDHDHRHRLAEEGPLNVILDISL